MGPWPMLMILLVKLHAYCTKMNQTLLLAPKAKKFATI